MAPHSSRTWAVQTALPAPRPQHQNKEKDLGQSRSSNVPIKPLPWTVVALRSLFHFVAYHLDLAKPYQLHWSCHLVAKCEMTPSELGTLQEGHVRLSVLGRSTKATESGEPSIHKAKATA